MGMYGQVITIPQIPFVMPSLAFLQAFDFDTAGQLQFNATLQHLGSGQKLAQAMGIISVRQPGHGFGMVKFANIIFRQDGSYVFVVSIGDFPEPITTNFDVRISPLPLQIPIPGFPQSRPPNQ